MTADVSAARVFELVWDALVGVLGTAATATMFRRAAKRAAQRRPDLAGLDGFQIIRDGLDYRWELPESWSSGSGAPLEAVAWLVREELCPVLSELTGQVVIDLLARRPELQRSGIFKQAGEGA